MHTGLATMVLTISKRLNNLTDLANLQFYQGCMFRMAR